MKYKTSFLLALAGAGMVACLWADVHGKGNEQAAQADSEPDKGLVMHVKELAREVEAQKGEIHELQTQLRSNQTTTESLLGCAKTVTEALRLITNQLAEGAKGQNPDYGKIKAALETIIEDLAKFETVTKESSRPSTSRPSK